MISDLVIIIMLIEKSNALLHRRRKKITYRTQALTTLPMNNPGGLGSYKIFS